MILQKIRSHSSQHHQDLENTALMLPLGSGNITLPQYILILKKFYGFFSALELRIDQLDLSAYLPDLPQRRKAKLLLDDLIFLGETGAVPISEDVPEVGTIAKAFGCLYVLEGSTLGGKVISEILQKKLQLSAQSGASFFYGYGKGTGTKWKLFLEKLQELDLQEMSEHELLEGVNETFQSFKKWLEKN